MKKHPGHSRIKPDKEPDNVTQIYPRKPRGSTEGATTGADHLKMTTLSGVARLGHFENLLGDAHTKARKTKNPQDEQAAFDLAKSVRELRRAHARQFRKLNK